MKATAIGLGILLWMIPAPRSLAELELRPAPAEHQLSDLEERIARCAEDCRDRREASNRICATRCLDGLKITAEATELRRRVEGTDPSEPKARPLKKGQSPSVWKSSRAPE